MEETIALKTTFGMVSALIGPSKWQELLRELRVFPDEKFETTMEKICQASRKTSERIWACLMHWRLCNKSEATVAKVLDTLHHIEVHWLAEMIRNHLESTGYSKPNIDYSLTCEECIKRHQRAAAVAAQKSFAVEKAKSVKSAVCPTPATEVTMNA